MTARLARFFSFPLLAKELTEAAARRRTFVTRVFYALLLYGIFATMIPRWIWSQDSSPLQAMGVGRELFEELCLIQMLGICLFLPAMMCGRIAQEKERDSLVLLLLTELKPWRIILEKYLGGLVPMLTFLLLGAPLAAIAYAFGGVTTWKLFGYLYALLVTCLQIGALSLLCSAWFRTTVGAFLATYFLGAAFYGGPPLAYELAAELTRWHSLSIYDSDLQFWSLSLIPITGVERVANYLESLPAINAAMKLLVSYPAPPNHIWKLIPPLVSIPVFLILARIALLRRAFAPPANFLLNLFRALDRFMKWANRLVGNVMLVKERENLPADAPIYWRETARRALGKANYLMRILVVVEIPVVAITAISAGLHSGGQADELSVLAAFLSALAGITLSVQAANTIVSERIQQTLEVLLTTPLSAREIVLEKARALRRLQVIAAIPLLTVFAAECWVEAGLFGQSRDESLAYIVCAVVTVAIYLPMIVWLSLWIGLRVRTRFRAIITALIALVLWCALPIVAVVAFSRPFGYQQLSPFWEETWKAMLLFSPATIGALNENGKLTDFLRFVGSPWPIILVNSAFYAGVTLLIRRHALANADRWLRR